MLGIRPSGIYVDATLGGGGHSRAILSELGPDGRLIVFDQDRDAMANAPSDSRVTAVRANFRFIHHFLHYMGIDGVDGILADLGVSSHQFDTPERGFSFRFDSSLDMRMNTSSSESAAHLLNTCSEDRLADILRLYGEVDGSRRASAHRGERGDEEPCPASGRHQGLSQAIRHSRDHHLPLPGRQDGQEFLQDRQRQRNIHRRPLRTQKHPLYGHHQEAYPPGRERGGRQHEGQKRETPGGTAHRIMNVRILENILGGQILAKGSLTRQWRFILYVFLLVILYISLHFWTRNTMQTKTRNEEIIRNLRSEYMGKYTRLLHTGKRGEIEKLLEDNGLSLIPPQSPPTRIKLKED